MAKKDKGKAVEGEEEETKKKKPIKLIAIVVVAAVGVKFFVLKDPAKTPAQLKADDVAAAQVLYNKCADANDLPNLGDMVTGGNDPATGKKTTTTTTAADTSSPAADAPDGPIAAADASVRVNLIDGNYLQVGIAVQLPVGGTTKLAKDDGLLAKATDLTLKALDVHTMDELTDPKKRDKVQSDLSFQMCRETKAAILKVYFTEFVMQAPPK